MLRLPDFSRRRRSAGRDQHVAAKIADRFRRKPAAIDCGRDRNGPGHFQRLVGVTMSIYDRFGVRTIINAKGPATRLSGGILDAEVTAAMTEAAGYCVDMAELQASASKVIAAATCAEAGIVTSGAAAGLLL